MKQKLIALFLIVVMAASALTVAGLATTTAVAATTPTQMTLTASTTTVNIGEQFSLTAKLTRTDDNAPLAGKAVDIWWTHPNGQISVLGGGTTHSDGHFTLPVSWATAGKPTFHASFGGDSQYARSTSHTLTMTVNKLVPTLTLAALQYQPPYGYSFSGKLTYSGQGVVGAVTLWQVDSSGKSVKVGTVNTHSDGGYKIAYNIPTTGTYRFYATYPGSSMYASAQTHSIAA